MARTRNRQSIDDVVLCPNHTSLTSRPALLVHLVHHESSPLSLVKCKGSVFSLQTLNVSWLPFATNFGVSGSVPVSQSCLTIFFLGCCFTVKNVRTSEGPCFFVKVEHGGVAAFKKAMENFDAEISSCRQINRKEFLATFEEPSTACAWCFHWGEESTVQ